MAGRARAMRPVVLVAAVAAVLALATGGPRIVTATPLEVVSELADIDAAMRFRESIGFPSSREYVEAAAADPKNYSIELVGVPLSDAESEEMLRRNAVSYAIGAVGMTYRDDPSYAGIYMDQKNGGIGYILFTGDAEARREAIAKALPVAVPFELKSVSRSMHDLIAIQAAIERDREMLVSDIGLVSTGIVPSTNAVLVGLDNPTSAAEEWMSERYGPGLTFRRATSSNADACNNDHDCRPMKGGLEINPHDDEAGNGNGHACTSGFVVRDTNGYYKILTAGHCIEYWGGYGDNWFHNNNVFGHGRYDTWANGLSRTADVGLTTISDNEIPSSKNQIYTGNGNIRYIIDVRDWDGWPEGGAVQRYGTTTGHVPGLLFAWLVSKPSTVDGYGEMQVTWANEVDFDARSGDSGGPVYALALTGGINRIALGTHVHSDPDNHPNFPDPHGWYSPQDRGRALYESLPLGAPYELCYGVLSPC
jgi:hypothetical protein